MSPFEDLGVLAGFSSRLGERNIHRPTDIQARVIPELLGGRSLAFRSATGTGKTFAYLVPLFQRFLADGGIADGPRPPAPRTAGAGPVILILAPTYELCSQIKGEADFLLKDSPLKAGLLIGSANISRQIDGLRKERPAVVVGNPGRILLLAGMGKLKFGALRSLVLDEGDRLAADDLRAETRELLTLTARVPDLVSVACSATLSAKNLEPLLPFMGPHKGQDLKVIESDGQEILRERIQHWAIWAEGRRKAETLRAFLAAVKPGKALVFAGRSRDAEHVVSRLGGLAAAALYSGLEKNRRRDVIGAFRLGKLRVLVSSDLSARGLDIPEITHVIALDVPDDAETYTHRAGRTGRAGKRGIMVSIGDEVEMRRLALIEKRLGLTVYPKEIYQGRLTAPAEDEGRDP